MLDRVEDLLAAHMPRVTYLRLDGKVPAQQRFALASKFNSDPSIDVMLLTTRVEGLTESPERTWSSSSTTTGTRWPTCRQWIEPTALARPRSSVSIGSSRVGHSRQDHEPATLQAARGLPVVNQQNAQLATMQTEELLELFQYSPAAALGPDQRWRRHAWSAACPHWRRCRGCGRGGRCSRGGGGGGAGRKRATEAAEEED